ncbi:MAG TPA: asparagine synthase (glutamine-hydrolyzing), partial [Caulobacterales bacterium]|nr:asparagine synthase (glutamine-hydrolyzing) [Caulobacterales bacterium]
MCGIAGIVQLDGAPIKDMAQRLATMNRLIAHRGPDGEGVWISKGKNAGLAHRRLSILDLSPAGAQPMVADNGTVLTHNGEVYNFVELREELKSGWRFKSGTDTEAVLASHERWRDYAPEHFRGMFAYALWDEKDQRLVAVRDRFGIKPFYYAVIGRTLYFASEIKALCPFLPEIETDPGALAEYLTFQFTLSPQTLFKHVKQLPPAHMMVIEDGRIDIRRYWDVNYNVDWDHTPAYFEKRLQELLFDSLKIHLRSDVPVGAYVSGGVDSSLIAILSAQHADANNIFFHGRFTDYPGYDESDYARAATDAAGGELHIADITAQDFSDHIAKVIYHLDHPVAGPGSFPQYEVSALAASKVKVVLGGQGGDEIFGGYARYLVAYLEQCLRAAIDGSYKNGNFVVTLESIIPRLGVLREYKPMLQQFWKEGLFGPLDERYFRLVNRSADTKDEIDWSSLPMGDVFETFRGEFNRSNVGKEAYLDKMTHFDFKHLLPALLQVEDRMGMAHGLESRVPLLDHPLVEFAATIPADVKFTEGQAKQLLKHTFRETLPRPILERRDKMGFPVPLKEWLAKDVRDYVIGVFDNPRSKGRAYVDNTKAIAGLADMGQFSRKFWGLFSLELWHQQFHDRA